MSAQDNLGKQFYKVKYYPVPKSPYDSPKIKSIKVDADLSSPEMRLPFHRGHCHALALAINEQSGHPIGAVYNPGSDRARHFFNYDKEDPKMGFDAHGYRPVTEIVGKMGKWNAEKKDYDIISNVHKKVTPEYVVKTTQGQEGWLDAHHDAARAIAPKIATKP